MALKRKHLKLMLAASNNSNVVTAVIYICEHFPLGALQAVDTAIEHWTRCRPSIRAASVVDFDSQKRAALTERLKRRQGNGQDEKEERRGQDLSS